MFRIESNQSRYAYGIYQLKLVITFIETISINPVLPAFLRRIILYGKSMQKDHRWVKVS